jgi:hypothetical protein
VGKKFILLLGVVAGGLLLAKKRRDAKAEADLWHEATSGTSSR